MKNIVKDANANQSMTSIGAANNIVNSENTNTDGNQINQSHVRESSFGGLASGNVLNSDLADETPLQKYIREKEQENEPERDYTQILTEQLHKANEECKMTYDQANKIKKTKYILKNKKELFE